MISKIFFFVAVSCSTIQNVSASPISGYGGSSASSPANRITVAQSGADYTSINSALAAASSGKTVLIHAGTYTGESNLAIPEGVSVVCEGVASTLISTHTNTAVFTMGSNTSIENCQIYQRSGANSARVITVSDSAKNVMIRNNDLRGGEDSVVIAGTNTDNVKILGNTMRDAYFDIISGIGTNVIIKDNYAIHRPTTTSESSFLFKTGGVYYLDNNVYIASRTAGVEGNLSFVRSQSFPGTATLESSNNKAYINAISSTAIGFHGLNVDTQQDIKSTNDFMHLTGGSTYYILDDTPGDAGTNFTITGGNGLDPTVQLNSSLSFGYNPWVNTQGLIVYGSGPAANDLAKFGVSPSSYVVIGKSGHTRYRTYTRSQINTLVPDFIGAHITVTDYTNTQLCRGGFCDCISTGTAAGQWSIVGSTHGVNMNGCGTGQ